MNNKRAQAALEFLTTYGWAFLVIIVMIGALAYFGVLNPEKFVSERCNLGVEFQCSKDTAVADSANDLITVRVTYMGDGQVSVTQILFNSTETNCDWDGGGTPETIAKKGSFDFDIGSGATACTGMVPGDKINGELTVFYNKDPAFPKSQEGELVISVT